MPDNPMPQVNLPAQVPQSPSPSLPGLQHLLLTLRGAGNAGVNTTQMAQAIRKRGTNNAGIY